MKNNEIKLVANVIMGDRPEPFLFQCMESIRDGVDLVILNDNSSNPENPNLEALKKTSLYREKKVDLLYSDFKELGGFAGVRNLCLERTEYFIDKGELPEENLWILYMDCDEVHPPSFGEFVREYLARVPGKVGVVDGYMYQFILTFDYYTTLERRHNLFFRFSRDVCWERPVHETLVNLAGERMATGYAYFHYGYMLSPEDLFSRWKLYDQYDGLDFDLEKVEKEAMLAEKAPLCIPFTGGHPSIMDEFIENYRNEPNLLALNFIQRVDSLRRNPFLRMKNRLRDMNYQLRLNFRNMQSGYNPGKKT